jgi:hypothetical protein
MHTKKVLIFIIMIILFLGCEKKANLNNSSVVINVNPHTSEEYINLSEIVDSVKCIKLELNPGDIMGRVKEIIIKKNYIYAIDISQKIIFVFDKTGKFISKLNKRGEGPDEYLSMGPVFIDDNEEYVELINYRGEKTTKLKYSNISFDLVDISPFPDVNCNSNRKKNGIYYFATQQLDNILNDKKTNAGLIIVDEKHNKKTLFDKNIETNNFSFSPNSESFTINDKNELFVSLMYDNTFYQLDAKEVHPVFSVNFEKHGINNAIGLESTEKQYSYIQNVNGLASFPVLNINNTAIMSFSYYFKQDEKERMYKEDDFRMYIKIKKNNKVYHVKKIKNDLTNFPKHIYISSYFFNCAHEVWYEDYLVDVVVPNYYFSDDEEKILVDDVGEITAYDDPIIVMMKLKKNEVIYALDIHDDQPLVSISAPEIFE